uniref:SPX domain-containing membrane protein n=1 Tax=Rhizophora mucronata TaxID=61149 RepID=A0A2P2J666_RHIMU
MQVCLSFEVTKKRTVTSLGNFYQHFQRREPPIFVGGSLRLSKLRSAMGFKEEHPWKWNGNTVLLHTFLN